jgi:hypothetical protein
MSGGMERWRMGDGGNKEWGAEDTGEVKGDDK